MQKYLFISDSNCISINMNTEMLIKYMSISVFVYSDVLWHSSDVELILISKYTTVIIITLCFSFGTKLKVILDFQDYRNKWAIFLCCCGTLRCDDHFFDDWMKSWETNKTTFQFIDILTKSIEIIDIVEMSSSIVRLVD